MSEEKKKSYVAIFSNTKGRMGIVPLNQSKDIQQAKKEAVKKIFLGEEPVSDALKAIRDGYGPDFDCRKHTSFISVMEVTDAQELDLEAIHKEFKKKLQKS